MAITLGPLPWINIPETGADEKQALDDAGLVLDFDAKRREWFGRGPFNQPDAKCLVLCTDLKWRVDGHRLAVGGTGDANNDTYVRTALSGLAFMALPAFQQASAGV